MNIITHQKIDQKLCGSPISIEPDSSRIKLKTDESMTVDHMGLVHGGFIFGLADTKFLKPVKVGDVVIAEAKTGFKKGKKHIVSVTVSRNEEAVFSGEFTCFVLDKHVLL